MLGGREIPVPWSIGPLLGVRRSRERRKQSWRWRLLPPSDESCVADREYTNVQTSWALHDLSLSFVHADMKNLKNYSNCRRSRLEKEWRIDCYLRDAIVHLLVDLCSCRDRASQRLFWIAWFDLAEVIHFLLHLVNTGASRQMLLQMLRHCCCTRRSTKSLTFESR